MSEQGTQIVKYLIGTRFGDTGDMDFAETSHASVQALIARGSCRAFTGTPVPVPLLNVLCAAAMSSPTKSDLQQRDIILLQSSEQRQRLAELVSGQEWVARAPMIAVFCGNNRRQRKLHAWHNVSFANDHLDAFFNAAADAAIALGAFVTAAEAVGLGCCPISAVRNEAEAVSELLTLPDYVFPFAGLAIGFPAQPADISKRLPLRVTCHVDHYDEGTLREDVETYDTEREASQPYATRRFADAFASDGKYGWSHDKVRQYSRAERADFGTYVRNRGFKLD